MCLKPKPLPPLHSLSKGVSGPSPTPTTLSELRSLNPIQKTLVHSQDWPRHLFTCAQAVVALVKQR